MIKSSYWNAATMFLYWKLISWDLFTKKVGNGGCISVFKDLGKGKHNAKVKILLSNLQFSPEGEHKHEKER